MPQPKVFGVGFWKTGTTSLARSLGMLGHVVLDHGTTLHPPARTRYLIERAVADGKPPFAYARGLARYTAFTDVRAVMLHFEYLDRHCPGSKFILHTRAFDSWWDSRMRQIERRRAAQVEEYVRMSDDWVFDRARWFRSWHAHHDRVRTYFADRPGDLLEIDVTAGDGWEKIVPFLGVAAPAQEFPRLNTAAADVAYGARADRSALRRVARQVRAGVRTARTPRAAIGDPWRI